jgi:cell division protein FtsL
MSLALEWKEQAYPAPGRGESRAREAEEARACKSEQERRRLRLTFLCFISVAAFVSGLFILTICLHVVVVQNEIKSREVERQIELERRQHEAMRLDIASLESPGRIENMAVEQLKMVQVTRAEYLETSSYQAAKTQEQQGPSNKEGMVSDATQGGL